MMTLSAIAKLALMWEFLKDYLLCKAGDSNFANENLNHFSKVKCFCGDDFISGCDFQRSTRCPDLVKQALADMAFYRFFKVKPLQDDSVMSDSQTTLKTDNIFRVACCLTIVRKNFF